MEIKSFFKKNFTLWPDHCALSSGFTLVELMIYMSLLSIFILIMTDLLTQILDLRVDASFSSLVIADGQYLKDRLSYDIRRSTAVITPAAANQTSDQLQLSVGGSTLTYSVLNTALVLQNGSTTQQLTNSGTSVSGFLVERAGNGTGKDTLTIRFTLESQATLYTRNAETKTYSYTIGLR